MNNTRTQIFIQARMGSKRLSEKVLLKIDGKSLLEILVERLRKVDNIECIVLATSKNKENDVLEQEAKRLGISCFRGSEENVLDRLYKASLKFKPDNIIRVTADCPLIDPELVNKGLEVFLGSDCDILSNHRERTFPDGMDFEIIKQQALSEAWKDNPAGATFINPVNYLLEKKKFKNKVILNDKNLSHIRLTVDYQEDYELIKIIYQTLYKKNKYFTLADILKFLTDNPQLYNLNKQYVCLDYGLRVEK